jgi:hypothetical protein
VIRIIALIGLLLLALPLQVRAQGVDRIAEYRAALAEAEDARNEEFALARTRGLLQTSFRDADIGFSQRYLDRWSATIFQRWARMRLFFGANDARLANWQAAVAAGEVSAAAAEAALAAPMAQVLDLADRIPMWLSDDVIRLTERAFWTDLAQSVGCCDALYYQALEEADQVWASSRSPLAATIAGLELLPPVGMPDFDTAAQAYAGLALRSEALALEGGDTPAARRTMLNDAALFADLFADRPATDLADLAAREGFAAAPVAPLLALARITEPGTLRTTLIEQARMRLEARAAYLDSFYPAIAADAPAPSAPIANQRTTGAAGGNGTNTGSGGLGGSSGTVVIREAQAQPAAAPVVVVEEMAVAAALAALQDDSQTGLATAAAAARAVDDMLMPGDVTAVLTAR